MKKIIRLTESDLARIVRRVIKEQGIETQVFKDSAGRTYNLPGITDQRRLDTFLNWSNGQYTESIIKTLSNLKLQGINELMRSAQAVSNSPDSPEGVTKTGNQVQMMNGVIRELLRLTAMKNITPQTPGFQTSLDSSFKNVNFTNEYKDFYSTITKQFPNFWQVFTTIANTQLQKLV